MPDPGPTPPRRGNVSEDTTGQVTKLENGGRLEKSIVSMVQLTEAGNSTVVTKENVSVLRDNTLKYLGVKSHEVIN